MIREVINRLNRELPATVKLVAVSKFHPFESIEEAYHAGQKVFGESRPQELLAKVKRLEEVRAERGEPDYMSDIEWHFIGHLQTNKLKMVLPYVTLVQSVDSVRLLEAIDSWGAANGKVTDVLLECHVAAEESKQGFSEEELIGLLSSDTHYANVRICGIMGMATNTDDQDEWRRCFRKISSFASKLSIINTNPVISMGMSDDYQIAIEEGSTMVRIGSTIFGDRVY